MNSPYVKEYNQNGVLVNPIETSLITSFPNRKERRKSLQKSRFYGCSKNLHLTVVKDAKFLRTKQFIKLKSGAIKVIEHYLPR